MPPADVKTPQEESCEHKHNSRDSFAQMVDAAKRNHKDGSYGAPAPDSLSSDNDLTDADWMKEEKARLRHISDILAQYSRSYRNKVDFQEYYRSILFWGCGLLTVVFSLVILCVLSYVLSNAPAMDVSGAVAIVTAIVSLVASVLGLVHTITKFCFPLDDEQYIVKIVESIQHTDLKRMKERNRRTEALSLAKRRAREADAHRPTLRLVVPRKK